MMSLTRRIAAMTACAAVFALPLSALTISAEAAPVNTSSSSMTMVSSTVTSATVTTAAKKYKNCQALNKKYEHGVGKKGAVDSTSGEAVTNFKRSNKIYKANKSKLDRDKDGIACEKR